MEAVEEVRALGEVNGVVVVVRCQGSEDTGEGLER